MLKHKTKGMQEVYHAKNLYEMNKRKIAEAKKKNHHLTESSLTQLNLIISNRIKKTYDLDLEKDIIDY